jgi:hypothetical protein
MYEAKPCIGNSITDRPKWSTAERLAANVGLIALAAAAAAFAATGLIGPAVAMAVVGGFIGYSLLYRIPKN